MYYSINRWEYFQQKKTPFTIKGVQGWTYFKDNNTIIALSHSDQSKSCESDPGRSINPDEYCVSLSMHIVLIISELVCSLTFCFL